jgi:hypothetical protein
MNLFAIKFEIHEIIMFCFHPCNITYQTIDWLIGLINYIDIYLKMHNDLLKNIQKNTFQWLLLNEQYVFNYTLKHNHHENIT